MFEKLLFHLKFLYILVKKFTYRFVSIISVKYWLSLLISIKYRPTRNGMIMIWKIFSFLYRYKEFHICLIFVSAEITNYSLFFKKIPPKFQFSMFSSKSQFTPRFISSSQNLYFLCFSSKSQFTTRLQEQLKKNNVDLRYVTWSIYGWKLLFFSSHFQCFYYSFTDFTKFIIFFRNFFLMTANVKVCFF